MSLKKSNPLYLSYLVELICHFYLESLKVFIVCSLLNVDYVLDNDYLKTLPLILDIIVPWKLLLFHHFSLNFLGHALFFQLSRLIFIFLLGKLSLFNFNSKSASNFLFIEILNCYVYTFLFGIWNCCITLRKTIFILVNFDLLSSCVQISSKYSCFDCKVFQLIISDILRKSRNIDKSIDLRLIPFLFLLLRLPFSLFTIPLLPQELLLSKLFLWFLFFFLGSPFLP